MKKIHEFTIDEETLVDKTETKKDESGNDVTTITKVKEKVPRKFFIRKPNRALSDAADLFYGEKFAEAFRRGLLPRALMEKRLNQDDVFSRKEQEGFESLVTELVSLQEKLQKGLLKPESERTDAEKAEMEKVKADLAARSREYALMESARSNLFANTCENYARNKIAVWWVLNLSYRDKDGKEETFFPGDSHDAKMAAYDEMAERETPLEIQAMQKFMLFTTFWLYNRERGVGKEEFEDLEKRLAETEKKEEVDASPKA